MSRGQKIGSFLNKVKTTAVSTGSQAGGLLRDTGSMAVSSTSTAFSNFDLPGEANRAAQVLRGFLAYPGKPSKNTLANIPREVISRAKGLAVFTVIKAGFMFSGKAGSGLVIARLPDGSWSAPSCIATAGLGWGLQAGADITEFVVILNSDDAVRAFSQGGNVTIGGQISAAAGPMGTGAQISAALQHPAPMFSYSRSKGLFAGVSLEGTILVERKETNKQFYGSQISATDILSGRVPAPEIANAMYEVIEAAEDTDLAAPDHQGGFVPTPEGGYENERTGLLNSGGH